MIPESEYGISGYISKTQAVLGKFKEDAGSFIVDEISNEVPRVEGGKYQILRIRLEDWETNKFVIYLARKLGISRKRVTYAGTKDKTGITTQLFCVNTPEEIPEFNLEGVEVLERFRSSVMLNLGDLRGNRFTVDLKAPGSDESIREVLREVEKKGGFPNFFGYQRFGSLRPITHRVGRLLVQNRYEEAVLEYLCDPAIDHDQFRIDLYNDQDFRRAIREFPERLIFERAILQHIVEKGTLKNAFSVLPKNLQIMFVHAYQSYLFNKFLSQRMLEFPDFFSLRDGESFSEVDELFNASPDERVANILNLERIADLSRDDRVRVVLPLVGTDTVLPKDHSDPVHSVLAEESVSLSSFRIPEHPELRSTGAQRIVSAKPCKTSIEKGILRFDLGRGIYASCLIREILKEKMFTETDPRSVPPSGVPF